MSVFKLKILRGTISQLAACAVMSKTDCLNADWQTVSFAVGFDGERDITSAYNRRADICAKHGKAANGPAFKAGHAQGIEQFCEIDNALVLGITGRLSSIKNQSCPERDCPGFPNAFDDGYQLHELNQQVYHAEHELDRLQNSVYRKLSRRANLMRQINSGELTGQEVFQAKYRRKQLRREIYSLE